MALNLFTFFFKALLLSMYKQAFFGANGNNLHYLQFGWKIINS